MSPSPPYSCFLETLSQFSESSTHPSLRNMVKSFPGLAFADGVGFPEWEDFPCCEGKGYQVRIEGGDFNKNFMTASKSVFQCPLKQRQHRVLMLASLLNDLLARKSSCQNQMGKPGMFFIKGSRSPHFDPLLKEITQQGLHSDVETLERGRHFASKNKSQKEGEPGVFWALALALEWRFGIHCWVMSLEKDEAHIPGVPLVYQYEKFCGVPKVIFLENVRSLWDAQLMAAFQQVVYYAQKAAIPLFIEERKTQKSMESVEGLSDLEREVAKLRQKEALSWLDEGVRSKLMDVCVTSSF